MKVACRILGYSQLVLLLFSVVGCGGGEKPVLVTGMVTLDGDPLVGAAVRFYSPETERNFAGRTDEQGEYRLRAIPGEYKVGISKIEGKETKDVETEDEMAISLMQEFEQDPTTEPPAHETIPARFSDIAQTELKFTVPAGGTDTADFMTLVSK